MSKITATIAASELTRRALPKGERPIPAKGTLAYEAFGLSGAALVALAGKAAPERTKSARKAKAPKATRPAALRLPDGRLVSAAATAEWKAGLGTYTERKALLTAQAVGTAQAAAKASVTTLDDLTKADALALLRTLLAN